jgi:hypothetical protein
MIDSATTQMTYRTIMRSYRAERNTHVLNERRTGPSAKRRWLPLGRFHIAGSRAAHAA